jgi:predicted DNA-binding protein YlxM (UPF0122 family)
MLKENQMKAIRLYFEGKMTVEEIARECGYKDRKSIYDILKKPEAQEYIEKLSQEGVREALHIMQINSKKLAKELLRIAEGDVKNRHLVYAQLQALNSLLEKAGLSAKNTVVIENKKSNDDQDYNELLDMLKKEEGSKEE